MRQIQNHIIPLQNETTKHSNVGGSSDGQSVCRSFSFSFAMRILPSTLWHNNGFWIPINKADYLFNDKS